MTSYLGCNFPLKLGSYTQAGWFSRRRGDTLRSATRSTCEREERPVATTFFALQALGPPTHRRTIDVLACAVDGT